MGKKWRFRAPVAGGALAVALALTVGLAGPAGAASVDDPTWAQVQAAQHDAAAAKAALAQIQTAVAALETQENAATAAQLKAAYAATTAAQALDAAQAELDDLDTQLTAAKKDAEASRARFVTAVVQMSRVPGGSDLTAQLLVSSGGSRDLLGRLGNLDQLGKRTAQLEESAKQKQNLVGSLEAQASAAQKARAALKADADAKLQAAQTAQAAAQQALAAGEAQRADLQQKAAALGSAATAITNTYQQNQAATTPPVGSTGGSIDTSGVVDDPAGAKAYARSTMLARYGWGDSQYSCLVTLWNIESGWRASAYNKSSGAYGIPQALPARKMLSAGADYLTNGDTQIDWGLGYIKAAYGTPCQALAFETSHVPYWY